MRILGFHAAGDPAEQGFARAELRDGRCLFEALDRGDRLGDAALVMSDWLHEPALVAIDAPLGLPLALTRGLAEHSAGEDWPHELETLCWRRTEVELAERLGRPPAQLFTGDRVQHSHVGLRWLAGLRRTMGSALPLAWMPLFSDARVIEVDLAAFLADLAIRPANHRGPGSEARARRIAVLDRLDAQVTWSCPRGPAEEDEDIFDAVLCAVIGQKFMAGGCRPPGSGYDDQVQVEGWIWH